MASYSVSLSAMVRLSGIRANDLVNELSMQPISTANLSMTRSKMFANLKHDDYHRYNRSLACHFVSFPVLFLFSSNDRSRSLSFTMTKRLSENQKRRKSYPISSLGGLYRNREQNATDEIHVDTKKFT